MALSAKQAGVRQVPWFSLTEWHEVYEQIYSNDAVEQARAYERLLAWKARIRKLPVGVDCTLSILQVCLRDREWTPKIATGELPISYENDLCLMYSTTIMRFLNYITNIGHTRQTSLFQIAKQLNIPEWIVNLRHDTAHGHELPSIGMLRIAINILLTWLHEEYWVAEAKSMQQFYANNIALKEAQETEEGQTFSDLIELWTAVSLYIHAGYDLVSDISDLQLRDTLQELRSFAISLLEENDKRTNENNEAEPEIVPCDVTRDTKYKLETAKIILLSEISRYLGKKTIPKKNDIVFDALFSIEAFFPSDDVLSIFSQKADEGQLKDDVLPLDMMTFWRDIIFVLYEKEMLDVLIKKLLTIINTEGEDRHKKRIASLWISSLSYCFLKLDAAQRIFQSMEYKLERSNKQLSQKMLESKIKDETESTYPHFENILWMDLSFTIPSCLTDLDFVSKLVLNANEFYVKFIPPILELVTPELDDERKEMLLNLINVYTFGKVISNKNEKFPEKTYTVEDVKRNKEDASDEDQRRSVSEDISSRVFFPQKIRNPHWKLALAKYEWSGCPIGILPWQVDALEFLSPLKATLRERDVPSLESEIVPGIIDSKDLKKRSKIKWENVLRRKRRLKRKYEKGTADVIVTRALETVKRQK